MLWRPWKTFPLFCTAYLQPGALLDIINASPGLNKPVTRLANNDAALSVDYGEEVPEDIIGNSNACEIVLDYGIVLTLQPGQVPAWRAPPGEQEPFDVTLFEDDKQSYAGAVRMALAHAREAVDTFHASPRPRLRATATRRLAQRCAGS